MSKSNRTKAEIEVLELQDQVRDLRIENEYSQTVAVKYGKLYGLLADIADRYETDSPKKLRKIDEFVMDKADQRLFYSIEK